MFDRACLPTPLDLIGNYFLGVVLWAITARSRPFGQLLPWKECELSCRVRELTDDNTLTFVFIDHMAEPRPSWPSALAC